jgi:hypothetical protein
MTRLLLEALVPFGDESANLLVHRTNLERSEANAWMLRHQFDGVVHVPGFEHEEPAQNLLRLGEGTIRDHHFAVLPAQRFGSATALQRLASCNPMTTLVKHLVKAEALLHHVGLFFLRHGLPCFLVGVSEADESHDPLRIRALFRSQDRANFDGAADGQRRKLPRYGDRFVPILAFDHMVAAELLPGFRERSVCDDRFVKPRVSTSAFWHPTGKVILDAQRIANR